MTEKTYLGSIEAGGTKFIAAVQDAETGEVVARKRIPTTDSKETLAKTAQFFKEYPVNALGIGTFGPIDINPNSRTFGYILDTPKRGWSGTNVKGYFEKELGVPVAMTTDVNASCYGEYIARGKDDSKTYFYITIGTGVGAGIVQAGKFVGLNNHPEIGHTLVTPYPGDDYEGKCPFHQNKCVEGMAAGPSLEARTGIPGEKLSRDNKVFTYVAYYVAQCLYNAYMTLRPDVMVVGGSVLNEDDLVKVRKFFDQFNNNYVATPDLDELIVTPAVADNGSATLGDFELARAALENK
ncbi:ROK family protein [Lactobacillus hominis]|uniref:fructokinase n=1 Tax=Lactobacillus hominis DSM 23910 = CRBIP 24.179 TaxID=1423758 RepID=I7JV78_9LACO|nr:ROK family protein [Lactobacillus hominis]KRM85011.1 transcriptional regulator and fructokinase [Lactobacillus hominis DSM 23910 = CRBIP 24.179]MCT3347969.1 ROK family protein [Lactobacillus hominis]CCI82361.1 Fructokinase [Lactobacillus hominis DSM 23910 = CRBIP 24.179]